MPKLTIEIDDQAFSEIEAAAAECGVSAADFVAAMASDGIAMHHGTVRLQEQAARRDRDTALDVLRKVPAIDRCRDDPLGYDTRDEDAAIRQMCDDALSGRNADAVEAEVAAVRRRFTPGG